MDESPDPVFEYRQHRTSLSALAFSPCGQFFASGDVDGNVKIYALRTHRPINAALNAWTPHSAGILSVAFVDPCVASFQDDALPCSTLKPSADENSMDAALPCSSTLTPCADENSMENGASSLVATGTEKDLVLLTHGRDTNIHIWKVCPSSRDLPKLLYSLPLQLDHAPDDSNHLLIAVPNTMEASLVDVYNISRKSILHREIGPVPRKPAKPEVSKKSDTGLVMCLKLLSNRRLYVGYESGAISCFNLAFSHQLLFTFKPFPQPIFSLDVYSQEEGQQEDLLVAGSAEDYLVVSKVPLSIIPPDVESTIHSTHLIELNTQLIHPEFDTRRVRLEGAPKGVSSVKWRPMDGRIIVCGCWDSSTLKPLAYLSCHRQGIEALAMHNDLTLAGGKDAKISLWRVYTSKEM